MYPLARGCSVSRGRNSALAWCVGPAAGRILPSSSGANNAGPYSEKLAA